jgi:hypothetical protein
MQDRNKEMIPIRNDMQDLNYNYYIKTIKNL